MIEIKSPNNFERYINKKRILTIFLGGSIEEGKAENWQNNIVNSLKDIPNVYILNPRRDGWDSSWKQTKDNHKFSEQVKWELLGQESCDMIVMYFDKSTQSPITLLELGLFAHTGKLLVCCPTGFFRKGNVDIVCERYNIEQVNDLNELIEKIKTAATEKLSGY